MIYDIQTLNKRYAEYSNIPQKIRTETEKGNYVRIRRGLYTDNLFMDGPVIANVCYPPSYLSFEYALSYYGLIPEHVSVFTSACFGKKNNKCYSGNSFCFEYRSIPDDVFPFGIWFFKNEEGIRYKIATREKALCDMLYSRYPVRSIRDLKILLYDDLRIDEEEFMKLDFEFMRSIAGKYHSNTLNEFIRYINEVTKK